MINRLSKTDYYMIQALWARVRSPDCSTRHGCIIVDSIGRPISTGYNGFPWGCMDHKMPQNRPNKYDVVIHSELNAILNAKTNLENSTVFISGAPCSNCIAAMLQVGVSKIIYGPIKSSSCKSVYKDDTEDNIKKFVGRDIEIIKWQPENLDLIIEELNNLIEIVTQKEMK